MKKGEKRLQEWQIVVLIVTVSKEQGVLVT